MTQTLLETITNLANSPYGTFALFLLAFAESSFFPIPPDVLLIPLALATPPLSLFFSLICTIGSVVGGTFGYLIGNKGGKPILKRFVSKEKIQLVSHYYVKYGVWAVGLAGFTPIPYKVFTISSGTFDLPFSPFVLASILGRGGRFFTVGLVIFVFGDTAKQLLDQYFELAIILFTLLLIGGFLVLNTTAKRMSTRK